MAELSTTSPTDADSVKTLLEATFGTSFDVWIWSDGWCPASGSMPYPAAEDALPPHLRRLLDTLRADPAEPRVADGEATGQWLLVPFPAGAETFYATCRIVTDSPHVWLQLARELLDRQVAQGKLEQLTRENREYAIQLSNDLEELVFLRCIADHIEFRGASLGLTSVAELVLPQLREAVYARALGLIVNRDDPTAAPIVWSGRAVLSDEECLDLVRVHRQQATQQPLVVNHLAGTEEDAEGQAVSGFILVPVASADRVLGWLLALNRVEEHRVAEDGEWRLSHHEFGSVEATLLQSAASVIAAHATTAELFREKERLLVNVVRAIVSAVETRDEYTRGHSERVALYGKRLAREMGYDEENCERIYLTCLLHDVGKIGISDATLRKTGRLTAEEYDEIKRHPDLGWAILHDLEQLGHLFPGIVHHHERYDGHGYPDGLAGDEVPLDARIVAVVDAYDAMTSDRPYRKGLGQEQTESILREGMGRQWDADVVTAFLRIMPEILHLKETYRRPQPSRRPAKQPADAASPADRLPVQR